MSESKGFGVAGPVVEVAPPGVTWCVIVGEGPTVLLVLTFPATRWPRKSADSLGLSDEPIRWRLLAGWPTTTPKGVSDGAR